jgi:ubiquinone/menaquinone biosynthesis C-methylase UbiE
MNRSFYENHILPYLLNVFMNTKATREERKRSLAGVKGSVLEVGFGSGLNLRYYPETVTKVVGIDPSRTSAHLARKRIAASSFAVEFVGLSAEQLPVADASFDSVVSTFTLCTIPDVEGALREMRRALKPEGRFYFVEHGHADDPRVARWQDRLDGVEQKVFGGCHLNRDIATLIRQAGFEIERLEHAYLKGAPKFAGFLYRGVAKRSIPENDASRD